MIEDAAAHSQLEQVIAEWNDSEGVLDDLSMLAARVWLKNVDRFEPGLGDDAVTLGIQSSRNVGNLATRHFRRVAGVEARMPGTLEVKYRHRVLHIGKVRSRSRAWDPYSIRWEDSEIRTASAEANSKVYVPLTGTLFESLGPLPGQPVDPSTLRHLHLIWQGLDDGSIRSWVGFPAIGDRPWFAVKMVKDGRGDGGRGGRDGVDGPMPTGPNNFDALTEPTLSIQRKPKPLRRTGTSQ